MAVNLVRHTVRNCRMTRLHMVLLILMCIGANVLQSGAETLLATEGDLVTLRCSLSGTFTYPAWLGPPSFFIYTVQDSPDINPVVNASDRLSYSDNKKDLLLTNAVVADSGEYKCSYAGFGVYTFSLNVSEKTSADCTCKSLNDCDIPVPVCILLWILIGLVIVGAGITGICLILHYCFDVKIPYCCKRKNTNSAAAEPQGTQNGEGQILHNRDTENSANYTKKRPPAKLEQLNEPGSEKHHIGGRPLPQIGKYN